MSDIVSKRCSKCKQLLSLDCFARHPKTRDGLQIYCKQCVRAFYEQSKRREKIAPPEFITCIACGQTKPGTLEFFGKNGKSPHGLYTKCKECMNAYNRQFRRDDPTFQVKQRERGRRWRTINPERNVFLRKRLRQQEHIKNQERAYSEQYRLSHLPHYRQWMRRYRTTEKWQSYMQEYKQREDVRIRSRSHEHKRRIREATAPGNYTLQDIERKLQAQKQRCYYCSTKFERRNGRYVYQIDHVVPLVKGGSNFPENIVLACPFCNQSKGAKDLQDWPEGGRLF